ncbi:Serine/threonine-protein kinase 17A [Puccinia graminis f. sp. tritici]|uniref:CAMK/CAMK1 protein kinase n=3 Tax=Puccinia graminis f. sp. tritici TaxID=56615 RepID=E3JVX4_PUCGT|nr:CAMK/CAMK1 protein kinase [Puccinia graminis f. sp. tritici CRL 75-36-700-3]EFP76199.1 CAMK/CAMK1 protein kinase [Puccinia graminis f. sp. tritici CRL 75-36-700-3]KAA1099423.1 Serine/threonine-protein kinase 17A [Puccinia graminis f. sp. tritici]KAA1120478.1 Serine/threonine-protein kinase 17A [Puccinia graminis f. sp. tritici]KAA1123226.1 Serine/threonine-protein kinase 17A [Puccinia graminis f. sp. tritici]
MPDSALASLHPKRRVLRALGLRDPNLHARKSEFKWGAHLGSGTYGEVTQCTWLTKNPPQEVAIKVVAKSSVPNLQQHISLMNRTLKLHHPHIVQMYDWFQSKEHFYMVLELATGGELFDHTITRGNFNDREACEMIHQVLDALSFIHSQGIVHRDLKPENLFVRGSAPYVPPYDLVVADFGVAVYVDRPDGSTASLTGICGSPGYTAPEVYRRLPYGKPVDIWATGVIAFILLSGRFPFAHLSGQAFLDDSDAEIKFPKRFAISPQAQNFILGCLQTEPSKRWTAEEALEHPWFDQLEEPIEEDVGERQTAASVADTDHTRCEQLPLVRADEPDDKQVESLATTAASSAERVGSALPPPSSHLSTPRSDDDPEPQLVLVHRSHTVNEDPPLVVDIVP